MIRRDFGRCVLAVAALVLCHGGLAPAAVLRVTTTDGGAGPDTPGCTLRDAITAANTNADTGHCIGTEAAYDAGDGGSLATDGDVIVLKHATYSLTAGDNSGPDYFNALPIISSKVLIRGFGATLTKPELNPLPLRMLHVGPTGIVRLEDVTLAGGNVKDPGAGLRNDGNTVVERCVIRDNANHGIFNGGTLVVNSTTISGNRTNGLSGAGIRNVGHMTLNQVRLVGNVNAVPFINNGADGGGLWNATDADKNVRIVNSLIAGNVAAGCCNGFGSNNGGGVYVSAGNVDIVDTTISGNNAGGGAGGGLYVTGGSVSLTHVTLTHNAARLSGGIEVAGGTVSLKSSLVVLQADDFGGHYGDCRVTSGSLSTHGYNIDSDRSCALDAGAGSTDIPGRTDPGLLDLADNGGFSETHALAAGSVARDHIPAPACTDQALTPALLTRDQRGARRPQASASGNPGSACDVGAFEAGVLVTKAEALTLDANADGIASAGDTLQYRLSFSNSAANAAAFTFSDSLGSDLSLASLDDMAGVPCTSGPASVACPTFTVAPGSRTDFLFSAQIDPASIALFVSNQATAVKSNVNVLSDDPKAVGTADATVTALGDHNQAPRAECADRIVPTSPGLCTATASVDAGSSDPDGDPLTLVQAPPGPYPLGGSDVTLTATDTRNASSSCTASVTVEDHENPVISCPADQTVECTGQYQGSATFAVTGTDNCSGPTTSCSASSGSAFPLGPNPVDCITTDSSGNQAACRFNVQVVDTRPPSLSCPAPQPIECTGPATRVWFSATAQDACAGAIPASCTSGSFGLGRHDGTCTAADPSGHGAACGFAFTIVDTHAPGIAAVTASPHVLWPPNHKMVPVAIHVDSSDLCQPNPSCQITSVTSNEPVDGPGADKSPDWQVTGPLTLLLRAERRGSGCGRVYTIGVACSDGSNSTSANVTVTVPHSQEH
jgi:hypothetical protein